MQPLCFDILAKNQGYTSLFLHTLHNIGGACFPPPATILPVAFGLLRRSPASGSGSRLETAVELAYVLAGLYA